VKAFSRAVAVERATGEVTAAELHGAKREGCEQLNATALGFVRVKRGGRVLYTGVVLTAGSRMN